MLNLLEPVLLIVVGTIAGFLNVTAGGGSLLSLPLLIFLGLSPSAANGTNRIALIVQNIFATLRFHKFNVIPKNLVFVTALPAVLGAILGAQIAVEIDQLLFKKLLAGVIVLLLPLILFGPTRRTSDIHPEITSIKRWWLIASFFGIGVYGGFIQGGIGFLFIVVLTFVGFDLVKTNALKVLVILAFSPFALLVFILNDQIDYLRGLTLAGGNAIGAWIGSRVVLQKGDRFLRWLVAGTAIAFAAKLLLGDG
ncbi:sulfite exporter TauE/SafE family protein [bacterium]|nr:sulfite exporter TauE/SafE family protein [bacterium]